MPTDHRPPTTATHTPHSTLHTADDDEMMRRRHVHPNTKVPMAPKDLSDATTSTAPSAQQIAGQQGELENDLPLSRVLLASLPLLLLTVVASAKLGLHKLSGDIIIAAIRTLVQLSCLALILTPIFHSRNHSRLFTCSYVLLFMLPLAAYEATARSNLTYTGFYTNSLMGLAIGVIVTLSLAVFGVVRAAPWYSPRVVIPLGGMLISNALSGMSLASSELLEELHNRSERIDVLLAFGATHWEATWMAISSVLSKALVPTVNSMNVIGLVAIPGMMTGQVLSGASPVRAARYQIMVMYLIAACTFLATAVTTFLIVETLFDGRGVYRTNVVVKNDTPGISQLLSSGSTWFSLSNIANVRQEDAAGMKVMGNLPPIELRGESIAVPHSNPNKNPVLEAEFFGSIANGKSFTASFSLQRGEIACLLGTSGIGKSTMMRSIAELSSSFREEVTTKIQLNGIERKAHMPTEWRRNVLYIPQGVSSTLIGAPKDLIADLFQLKAHKMTKKKNAYSNPTERVASLLREWGILDPDFAMDKSWSDLSGGESQRLLLAIALILDSEILLIDEGLGALDEATKLSVEATMKRLRRTVLMVTHDEDQATRICSSRWRLSEEGDV